MDWSKHQIICNKHPNEIPQPGVCPSCLRERLSRLITTGQHSTRASFFINSSSSSSSSSSSPVHEHHYNDYSSASSASDMSPRMNNRGGRGHQRVASDVLDSVYLSVKGNINNLGLNKSRSIAFAASNVVRDCHDVSTNKTNNKKKKKKKGFWNKFRFSFGSKTKI